jgi:hypothetical protein
MKITAIAVSPMGPTRFRYGPPVNPLSRDDRRRIRAIEIGLSRHRPVEDVRTGADGTWVCEEIGSRPSLALHCSRRSTIGIPS